MQITIRGDLTMSQLRQAILEKLHELEDGCALAHSKGATLYVNPTDELGEPVMLRTRDGKPLRKLVCDGPYDCAAEEYKI